MFDTKEEKCNLLVGIDVGSTTTKVAVIEDRTGEELYSSYQRHHAAQMHSVRLILEELEKRFPGRKISLILTGSGSKPISDDLGAAFIQEVVANTYALQKNSRVRTAIELGGQDAKIIFFGKSDSKTGIRVKDMRMNGSCAGGTGAFIDEIASVLNTPVENFNALAAQGTCVYDISGRCGVYAKTDIQPLLNQGASKADIALSAFHAIAKQTIGGLAQGLTIEKPVVFEGGPMTFHPVLIRVFAQRLQLSEEDIIVPEHPELMVAFGAAYSLLQKREHESREIGFYIQRLMAREQETQENPEEKQQLYFKSADEKEAFYARHKKPVSAVSSKRKGKRQKAYLGIDSGSTTTKFVLMDEKEEIIDSFYASNRGTPLDVAKNALLKIRVSCEKESVR